MKGLLALFATLLMTALALWLIPASPPLPPLDLTSPAALSSSPPQSPIRLVDESLNRGVVHLHQQRSGEITGLNEALGAGGCALDYDGDGWMDLLLLGGSGNTYFHGRSVWWQGDGGARLYRNLQGERFRDVTEAAGLESGGEEMGCAAGDLDNDGDQDLLVTRVGANLLLRNEGDGRFSRVDDGGLLNEDSWSTSAALADFDGDGLLDIYVVNYVRYRKELRVYEGNRPYAAPTPSRFRAELYDPAPNRLYRNLGEMRFEEVGVAAGVANPEGRGLAAIWLDGNRDGLVDLWVSNDKESANRFYLNLGEGRFAERGDAFGLGRQGAGRGLAMGGRLVDGRMALMQGGGAGEIPWLYSWDEEAKRFEGVTRSLGLDEARLGHLDSWGVWGGDLDNDGWEEWVLANGLALPDPDAPGVAVAQPDLVIYQRPECRPDKRSASGKPSHLGGCAALIRPTELSSSKAPTPTPLTRGEGLLREPLRGEGAGRHSLEPLASSRSVFSGDFDNDGRMDLVVTANNDYARLLMNRTEGVNGWIGFSLQGVKGNRDAIGARIRVIAGGDGEDFTVEGQRYGFLSTSDPRLLVGLGEGADSSVDVEVSWPNGGRDRYSGLGTGRYWRLREGETKAALFENTASGPEHKGRAATYPLPAQARVELYRLLLSRLSGEGLADLLDVVADDTEGTVRRGVIGEIRREHGASGLSLVLGGLADSDVATRLAAVERLGVLESEYAVVRLLSALADDAPEVRAAVCGVFEHYFTEEEAVVDRKWLALPALLDRLRDDSPEVRIAAAGALAEAERYRALYPLLRALNDEVVLGVRVALARALGRLRHGEALGPLRALVANRGLEPSLRAEALVAVRRLASDVDEGWLELSSDHALADLRTLLALHGREGGAVIDTRPLDDRVRAWLDEAETDKIDPTIAEAAWSVLASSGGKSGSVMRWMGHPEASVRAVALLGGEPGLEAIRQGLGDGSAEVREAAALAALSLPRPRLEGLPQVAAERPSLGIIRLATRRGGLRDQQRLREWAGDQVLPMEWRLAALEGVFGKLDSSSNEWAKRMAEDPNERIRLAMFERLEAAKLLRRPPLILRQALKDEHPLLWSAAADFLAGRSEPWVGRMVQRVVMNRRLPLEKRRRFLASMMESDPGKDEAVMGLLKPIVGNAEDPLRMATFDYLAVSREGREVLEGIMGDDQESSEARVYAARALLEAGDEAALRWLLSFAGLNDLAARDGQ